jgi:hypothetical protein
VRWNEKKMAKETRAKSHGTLQLTKAAALVVIDAEWGIPANYSGACDLPRQNQSITA